MEPSSGDEDRDDQNKAENPISAREDEQSRNCILFPSSYVK